MNMFIIAVMVLWQTQSHEEITVKGTRTLADSKEDSSFNSTIKTDDPVSKGWSLPRTLSFSPSINIQSTGSDGHMSFLMIRGSAPSHVNWFIDTIPVNPGMAGTFDVSIFPLISFTKLTVFRGFTPPAFGNDGIGGSVNLTTGISGDNLFISNTLASFGTLGYSISASSSGKIPFRISGRWYTTSGNYKYYRNNGTEFTSEDDSTGERKNNQSNIFSLMINVPLCIGSVKLKNNLLFIDSQSGLPGPVNMEAHETSFKRRRGFLSSLLTFGTGNTWLRAAFSGEILKESFQDKSDEMGVGAQETSNLYSSLFSRASFNHLKGNHFFSLQIGARGEYLHQENTLALENAGNHRRFYGNGSARYRFKNKFISVQIYSAMNYLDSTAETAEVMPSGAASISLNPQNWPEIRLNFRRAYRSPTFLELYGNSGTLKGNPNLESEYGYTGDVGIIWKKRNIQFEGALFFQKMFNLIQFVPNSQFVSVSENAGSADIYGAESAGSIKFPFDVDFRVSVLLLKTENTDRDSYNYAKPLPGRPRTTLSSTLSWKKDIDLWRLSPAFTVAYTEGAFFDSDGRRPVPARYNLSFLLGIKTPWKGLNLTIEGRNLENRISERLERLPPGINGRNFYMQGKGDYLGYPVPGRTIFFTLSYEQ
ncbi:TonB-dependent receptor [Myxococcota bacterium]|nr:TonB-dependent receptor [Myxococcota bacterium]MBU1381523.1 TonB-dependent receptor [Myxococcota bacterium]MBU1496542.1 TonB-dependent receptor [Myxococcota bacterium]